MRPTGLLVSLLLPVLLVGCVLGPHAGVLPTIGPISLRSGRSGVMAIDVTASTNCAEIGEPVTFTATLTSEANAPLTITTRPVVDFVLRPVAWEETQGPEPIQRWSQTSSYPSVIDPVFAPGEQRQYQWVWIADAVYGQFGVNGVRAQFFIGAIPQQGFGPGGDEVWVGVRTMPGGESSESGMRCADMRRP